jgi:hypothetical protein
MTQLKYQSSDLFGLMSGIPLFALYYSEIKAVIGGKISDRYHSWPE